MDSQWLFFVLFVATTSSSHAYPCNYSWNGVNYDASPLANPNQDYHWTATTSDTWMNVCRPTVTQLCGPSSATCYRWASDGHASMGDASTAQFAPANIPGENGQGFRIIFTGGDIYESRQRTMEINFICDSGAGVGEPSYSGQHPPLNYNFQWRSKYACASSPPPPCSKFMRLLAAPFSTTSFFEVCGVGAG
eukprot:TRINITY_DN8952_c0_g1_i1.p1 TRINITY_DN8952_c0_g1~~TRINITY_DN8952_c0_g1_i1.p1  ORF type:complete len:192 (-),score=6.01 TRINITY_DN8952_c0_g1_i1:198-773(-)